MFYNLKKCSKNSVGRGSRIDYTIAISFGIIDLYGQSRIPGLTVFNLVHVPNYWPSSVYAGIKICPDSTVLPRYFACINNCITGICAQAIEWNFKFPTFCVILNFDCQFEHILTPNSNGQKCVYLATEASIHSKRDMNI